MLFVYDFVLSAWCLLAWCFELGDGLVKRWDAAEEFGIGGGDGVFEDALDGGGIPGAGTGDRAAVLGDGLARHLGGDGKLIHDCRYAGECAVALVSFP